MIEIFPDRVEITNPGTPLIDTLRFIDEPPRSRNEALASIMRRLNICEERGSGIDKDRIRACYEHACLCWVSNKMMTNATLRERLGIEEKNYATASRIIAETVTARASKNGQNRPRFFPSLWPPVARGGSLPRRG